MARILILGAGVMGSALAVPAGDNGHEVRLVGTHLDGTAIEAMKRPGGIHPKLDQPLPPSVMPMRLDELRAEHCAESDQIVVGVSSPGIAWAIERLKTLMTKPKPVAFVTKGLARRGEGIQTYAESVPPALPVMTHFIGIGGPCIARELANRMPTASVYASKGPGPARSLAALMETPYYRLAVGDDPTGVEACAALKNFYAIGVSAMHTRHSDPYRGGPTKNPTASAFNQAVREMAQLCETLGGRRDTAFDLAGVGDLHVTVGGGRNSRLGHALGEGKVVSRIMAGELAGETVEGIDTGRVLSTWFGREGGSSRFDPSAFPLASAIIEAICEDTPFVFH